MLYDIGGVVTSLPTQRLREKEFKRVYAAWAQGIDLGEARFLGLKGSGYSSIMGTPGRPRRAEKQLLTGGLVRSGASACRPSARPLGCP